MDTWSRNNIINMAHGTYTVTLPSISPAAITSLFGWKLKSNTWLLKLISPGTPSPVPFIKTTSRWRECLYWHWCNLRYKAFCVPPEKGLARNSSGKTQLDWCLGGFKGVSPSVLVYYHIWYFFLANQNLRYRTVPYFVQLPSIDPPSCSILLCPISDGEGLGDKDSREPRAQTRAFSRLTRFHFQSGQSPLKRARRFKSCSSTRFFFF